MILDTINLEDNAGALEISLDDEKRKKKQLQKQIEEQKLIVAKNKELLKVQKMNLKNLMDKVHYFNPKNLPERMRNEFLAINNSRKIHPDFDQKIKRAGYSLSQKNKSDENNNQTRGRKMR